MTRFCLLRVRPGQPRCWKITPVYCACQEANTIYCTLDTADTQNLPTYLFAELYRPRSKFHVVSSVVLPQFFIHKPALRLRGRCRLSQFLAGPIRKLPLTTGCFDSTRHASSGQCRCTVDCVDKEGFLLKSRPPLTIAVHEPRSPNGECRKSGAPLDGDTHPAAVTDPCPPASICIKT